MTGKNIIIPEANRVEIVDRPVADPGPGEVRVKLVRDTVSSGTVPSSRIVSHCA